MSATLSIRIPNFSTRSVERFTESGAWNSIGNFEWQLAAEVDEIQGTSYLGIWLHVRKPPAPGDGDVWSVKSTLSFRAVNHAGRHRVSNDTAVFHSSDRETAFDGQIFGEAFIIELDEILREGSGFLAGDELTVACDIDVHADACPIFEGLLGIKHCMHDVALVVEGHKVYANKAMLASHSPYFKAMFFGDFTEAQKDEIELKDVPFDAWHEFYSVVYANCAVVNGDNVKLLIPMADRFRVEWLLSRCERCIIYAKDMNVEKRLAAAEKLPSGRVLKQLVDGLTEADLNYLKKTCKSLSLSKHTIIKLFLRA